MATTERPADAPETIQRVLRAAIETLIALAARDDGGPPYGELALGPDYLKAYPINLAAFRQHCRKTWRPLSMRGWLDWLIRNWAVDMHMRVALRKLRGQGSDTFRIRPMDDGLVYVGWTYTLHATYSSPRFRQATQLMADLGLLSPLVRGARRITPRGVSLLEAHID